MDSCRHVAACESAYGDGARCFCITAIIVPVLMLLSFSNDKMSLQVSAMHKHALCHFDDKSCCGT